MKTIFISLFTIGLSFSAGSSFAADAPKYKSEGSVESKFDAESDPPEVTVMVKRGFHVNEAAPNKLTLLPSSETVKPALTKPTKLVFQLNKKQMKQSAVKVSAYVCDDALTVCETREWSWDLKGQAIQAEALPKPAETAALKPVMVHGFYQDALEVALLDCKTKKKPVLLEFSARWCPGCMRLEKEMWTSPIVAKTLNKFVKVKMDTDRFQNKALMERYGVAGIPTTLILNCEGQEVERFVDYQERDHFASALDRIAKANLPTKAELIEKAKAGDASSALKLAIQASLSYRNDEALEFFAMTPDREAHTEYWSAKIAQLSKKSEDDPKSAKAKDELKEALRSAIAHFGSTPSSLDWRAQLADLSGAETKEGKETLQNLVRLCDDLIQDKAKMESFVHSEFAGDYMGIETIRVYQAKAEALETLGQTTEAESAWKAAVAEGKRVGIRDEPTGQFFRFLPILKKAKENERITKFFEKYLKRNPNDGELLRRYAKFQFDAGDFKRAAELSAKSIENSYDDNEIFAATLHAKALAKLGQTKEARESLLKYQIRADLTKRAQNDIQETLSQIK